MKIGDKYTYKTKVTEDMTAAKVGSGALEVFGTPFLLGLMENAALQYMKPFLPEGKSTVGTMATLVHSAPSPVGIEVTVEVTVTDISANGKIVDFSMEAFDEVGEIGTGTHQRAIIDIERFLARCDAKLNR